MDWSITTFAKYLRVRSWNAQESSPRVQCCIVYEASFFHVDFVAPTTTTPSIRDLLPQPSS